ncbi:hypothetical protein IU487_32740 [Nocardia puris]|uniref:hypothetical protein n=1 Tax=Nocardia puris TaxID=208602 RepID=UPI001893E77F|nr:hypothetical protein [Nocardia puris]MBF6215767.1 hypothetical protein [Nocardia puris]
MSTTTESARTAVEDALWAVISTDPKPATELANDAGISQSKTRKLLNMWAADGSISRHTDDTNPHSAARWSIAPTEPGNNADTSDDDETPDATEAESSAPETDTSHLDDPTLPPNDTETGDGEAALDTPATDSDDGSGSAGQPIEGSPHPDKLAPGALRGLVEDHLRDHPGQEFTPHQIGKALGGRSSGAVHNALVRLTDTGVAEMTTARPKKFALAPSSQS